MSHPHDIDKDESIFHFDLYEAPLLGGVCLEGSSRSPALAALMHRASLDSPATTIDETTTRLHDGGMTEQVSEHEEVKGKGVSRPLPIRPQTFQDAHDVFDMSPCDSDFTSNRSESQLSPPMSPSSFDFQYLQTPDDLHNHNIHSFQDDAAMFSGAAFDDPQDFSPQYIGKGKAKELPPTLPPLNFSPTELSYGTAEWPATEVITPTPGPSSYGSAFALPIMCSSRQSQGSSTVQVSQSVDPPTIIRRVPSRRRSFSSFSTHSTRSIAARSMSKFKGASRAPSNLARKLLSRAHETQAEPSLNDGLPSEVTSKKTNVPNHEQTQSALVWRRDSTPYEHVPAPPFLTKANNFRFNVEPQALALIHRDGPLLKGTDRSYSLPLPTAALDIQPAVSVDIFAPIPLVLRNVFDEVLPREIRLDILLALIALHEVEHQWAIQNGQWSVMKASRSKSRWVGRDGGLRELVKFSRVSKSWQKLVFDGQIWSELTLCSFPRMPPSLIAQFSKTAGPFPRTLDLTGHSHLLSSTLLEVTDNLCLPPVLAGNLPYTQLTSVNLQGCTALTTRALHHILIRSPSLQKICLRGLASVTNTTCDVLAVYCPQLVYLDISRCPDLSGDGIRALCKAATSRGMVLPLKELHLSGLRHVYDSTMAALGRAAPYLEVLDLSYIRHLHNSALEAFVSCGDDDDDDQHFETILLTARQAGRDQHDSNKYRRRITRLRHLSLSSCLLITDIACSNLAHTMPRLEFLEIAGIGAELKDDGLIRLLNTTPLIRRLDLEDATDITDTLLATLTPGPAEPIDQSKGCAEPQTGQCLEHLIISYANNLTNEALLHLVRGCPRLQVLEADNTALSGTVLKEFIRLNRKRRAVDAKVVAVDCRGVSESVVKDVVGSTRPRKGWRAHDARRLHYVDGRDEEDLKAGQNECDENKVVLKTFYSWQTVDALRSAREKRRKSNNRRAMNESAGSDSDSDEYLSTAGRARWWSPGGGIRRTSGANSPTVNDMNNDRDGCRIM